MSSQNETSLPTTTDSDTIQVRAKSDRRSSPTPGSHESYATAVEPPEDRVLRQPSVSPLSTPPSSPTPMFQAGAVETNSDISSFILSSPVLHNTTIGTEEDFTLATSDDSGQEVVTTYTAHRGREVRAPSMSPLSDGPASPFRAQTPPSGTHAPSSQQQSPRSGNSSPLSALGSTPSPPKRPDPQQTRQQPAPAEPSAPSTTAPQQRHRRNPPKPHPNTDTLAPPSHLRPKLAPPPLVPTRRSLVTKGQGYEVDCTHTGVCCCGVHAGHPSQRPQGAPGLKGAQTEGAQGLRSSGSVVGVKAYESYVPKGLPHWSEWALSKMGWPESALRSTIGKGVEWEGRAE